MFSNQSSQLLSSAEMFHQSVLAECRSQGWANLVMPQCQNTKQWFLFKKYSDYYVNNVHYVIDLTFFCDILMSSIDLNKKVIINIILEQTFLTFILAVGKKLFHLCQSPNSRKTKQLLTLLNIPHSGYI